jgi:hypothetical protein
MINTGYNIKESSFPKFFVYHPKIKSEKHLKALCERGLEVMHLEQKRGSTIQKRLVSSAEAKERGLMNYEMVHDHLISLPLTENLNEKEIAGMLKVFINTILNQ